MSLAFIKFLRLVFVGLLVAIAASSAVIAQTTEPSREPILRIETGMHTAAIWRIGVDRAGKFLVTASHDKTARVWELETGRLLRVLRVPVGDGNEGKLFAAAISPDGHTIAAGGFTSGVGEPSNLYLFERESGRLVRRLTDLPNVVNHLAFSPDGAMLAATLGGTNGVRVWRTSDWTEVGRDTAYGDQSYGADFDPVGRLVTSCYDGHLRLYDRTMRLVVKQAAPGGKRPFTVRFSPDGRKVAVGYDDSTRVDVLSGETLALLYGADTSGINNGDMSKVAWSKDGTVLYAGGRYSDNSDSNPIRRWSEAGRGRYVDTPAADNTLFDIAPLPAGGIVYGAADPSWGILDAHHKRTQTIQAGQIADYRDSINSHFFTDTNARAIRFGYQQFGVSPAVFQLSDRTLKPDAPASNDMRPPRTEAPGLSLTDWKNTETPRLNNTPLKLKQYERSRSVAIAPDGKRFLLGTDWYVHLFNSGGQELWEVPAPDVAWALNISGDGRVALAAYGDGTIRWYRMSDGKELLAFFPHKDRKRWILWTPSGYYDAAPGAEDLMGWHVNNGKDQAADFFPVGQFRSTYYRPDVIARVLQTGDEQLALKQANEEAGRKQQESVAEQLPPVVEIISPRDGVEVSTGEVTVQFRIRTPSGEPVTGFRALVDGRPSGVRQLAREENRSNQTLELRVTVPERDSEIAVIAENRFTSSVPAIVRVKWRSAAAARPETFVVKPKLYILAVGVSRYANDKFNLKFADKDASDFVKVMTAQKDLLYREVIVKLLTNEKATKDEVLDGLDWIRQETTSNDVAMVFFAGHGVNDQNNYYYFCPYNIDPTRLLRTGVAFSDIKNTVSAIAGKALFFVDTCHSGNSIGLSTRRGPLDINIVINELSSAQNGVVVFSAATGSESSYEREEWNNGAFTKALVEGLSGAAALGNSGRITYNMLNVYLSERVKEITRGQQHPTMISPNTVPDFPIAMKK